MIDDAVFFSSLICCSHEISTATGLYTCVSASGLGSQETHVDYLKLLRGHYGGEDPIHLISNNRSAHRTDAPKGEALFLNIV
jgi:hypothetical protein